MAGTPDGWWSALEGPSGLGLGAFCVGNLVMILAIVMLGLYQGVQRRKRLTSLEILAKPWLGSELFEASRVRSRVEYLLMPTSGLIFGAVMSALATLVAVLVSTNPVAM